MPLFRPDSRLADQLRPTRITPGYVSTPEGSVLIEAGNTRVLCNATVETGVPGWMRNSGRGWVTAEYGMLPRATLTRSPREAKKARSAAAPTRSSASSAGPSAASSTCAPSASAPSSSTATSSRPTAAPAPPPSPAPRVALAIALSRLVAAGTLKHNPLKQMIAATSVGIVDGNTLLDLCYEEDSRATVDMNVVMLASGGLVETQATAEKDSYSRAELNRLLDLAETGIHQLLEIQQTALASALAT